RVADRVGHAPSPLVHAGNGRARGTEERATSHRQRELVPMSEAAMAGNPPHAPSARSTAFQLGVVLPMLAVIAIEIARDAEQVRHPAILFWMAVVIAVDLIPVPGWGDLQLSLSFPILLGVAIVYTPTVAALVALVGSFDPRELHHEVTFLKA